MNNNPNNAWKSFKILLNNNIHPQISFLKWFLH